jgi:hypothetical protein
VAVAVLARALAVLTGEPALARRPLGRAREAGARHVLEHVVPDAPVGDRPATTAGPRLLVLLVVDVVPRRTGVVV